VVPLGQRNEFKVKLSILQKGIQMENAHEKETLKLYVVRLINESLNFGQLFGAPIFIRV